MKKILLVLTILILSSTLYAKEDITKSTSPETGAAYLNGRYWRGLSTDKKVVFIQGYDDALLVCRNATFTIEGIDPETVKAVSSQVGPSIPPNTTVGDLIKYLDNFYANILNVKIPICVAQNYICTQIDEGVLEGGQPEEGYLKTIRRNWSR